MHDSRRGCIAGVRIGIRRRREQRWQRGGEDWRPDFEQALGETFGEHVSPPVPFEDASPHECCEVVWAAAGRDVTPARLAALGEDQVSDLARKFGEYFECDALRVRRADGRAGGLAS